MTIEAVSGGVEKKVRIERKKTNQLSEDPSHCDISVGKGAADKMRGPSVYQSMEMRTLFVHVLPVKKKRETDPVFFL